MIAFSDLPTVNAFLNGTAAVLLAAGYAFIRRGEIPRHRLCMVSAFIVSSLFLVSYLTYHFHEGTTRFAGTGGARTVYFALLSTHTLLATAVPFLAIASLWLALRARYERHRKVARLALPVWLYVSVTGVVIYLLLYHLFPSPRA